MSRYQLADGSWSDEYKIGDKFVVEKDSAFKKGSIIEFKINDSTSWPLFKLIKGICLASVNDNNEDFAYWSNLRKYEENSMKKEFTKDDLKDGMVVTLRGKNENKMICFGDILIDQNTSQLDNDDFYDDLTSNLGSHYDIMKVEFDGKVIWERDESKESLSEKDKKIQEIESEMRVLADKLSELRGNV